MKLSNLVLIYDDHCPLCSWYTSLFVKSGLLKTNERIAFTAASESLLSMIGIEKGKNEIPLLDLNGQRVYYGIDAMLVILGQKFPLIKTIGILHPVNWFLRKLYKFISFNRKVIVAKKCGKGEFDCSPEFNTFYRFAFLLLFFVFNSVMLYPIHRHILSGLSFYHLSFQQLELAHLLFVFCNCLVASFLPFRTSLEYLGQVNMLALCTVLLSVPLILLGKTFAQNEILIASYLFILLLYIIKEYFRRMRYAGILVKYGLIPRINFACLVIFLTYLFI